MHVLVFAILVGASDVDAWRYFANLLGNKKVDITFVANGQMAENLKPVVDTLSGGATGELHDIYARVINSAKIVSSSNAKNIFTGSAYCQMVVFCTFVMSVNLPTRRKGLLISGIPYETQSEILRMTSKQKRTEMFIEEITGFINDIRGQRTQTNLATKTNPWVSLDGSGAYCEFVIVQRVQLSLSFKNIDEAFPFLHIGGGVSFSQSVSIAKNVVLAHEDIDWWNTSLICQQVNSIGFVFNAFKPTKITWTRTGLVLADESQTLPELVADNRRFRQISLMFEIPSGETHTVSLSGEAGPEFMGITTNISVQSSIDIMPIPPIDVPSSGRLLASGNLHVEFGTFNNYANGLSIILEGESDGRITTNDIPSTLNVRRTNLADRNSDTAGGSASPDPFQWVIMGAACAAIIILAVIVFTWYFRCRSGGETHVSDNESEETLETYSDTTNKALEVDD